MKPGIEIKGSVRLATEDAIVQCRDFSLDLGT